MNFSNTFIKIKHKAEFISIWPIINLFITCQLPILNSESMICFHEICLVPLMFSSSHFSFPFLVTYFNEVTKILCNLCLHFPRQDGQDRKKWKENNATKVTKVQKTKRWKYGINETKVTMKKALQKGFNLNLVHKARNLQVKRKTTRIQWMPPAHRPLTLVCTVINPIFVDGYSWYTFCFEIFPPRGRYI